MTAPVLPVLLNDGVAATSSTRTQVTCAPNATTSFTIGTEVTIDPSTSADSNGLWLYQTTSTAVSAADSTKVVRIKVGGVVRWQLAVGNMPVGMIWILPGFIPSGSNVTIDSWGASRTNNFVFYFGFLSAAGGQKYGLPENLTPTNQVINTSAKGIAMAGPASNNTKGAWTELISSTASLYEALIISVQANGDTSMNAQGILVDIGIGPGGSETVLIGDLYFDCSTVEQITPVSPMTYGIQIPAGSRLSARWQGSSFSGDSFDVSLIGVLSA
jgi:hypothetical protein